MNKKGFTLAELLGVIAILAIIALIALPSVTNLIATNKEKAYNTQISEIKSGMASFVANQQITIPSGSVIKITLYQLASEGYIDLAINNPKTGNNFPIDTLLTIANNGNNFTYTVDESVGTKVYSTSELKKIGTLSLTKDIVNTATSDLTIYMKNSSTTVTTINNTSYISYSMTDSNNITMSVYLNLLDNNSIYSTVINKFPYLVLGSNGCATNTSGTNYSYMGGCYLAGKHTDNYIWYSGFVWRIMGINNDYSVRMITEEDETTIPYNAENTTTFKGSYAEDWLNNYFYSHLKNTSIIINGNWCERGTNYITTSSTANSTTCVGTTINDKIGLISLDEYNLASAASSYLINFQYFRTLTPADSYNAWVVNHYGNAYRSCYPYGLRPVINVNSASSITKGIGTLSDNYILEETKETNVTGNLNDIATSGEYVTLANKTYRVVSIDSSGNTKLILDGYYEETAGTNYTMAYGSTNTFDTTTTTGIGYKLNNDVLNYLISSSDTTNRNKLVTYNWYQNVFDYGNSYTVSLNETSPTRTISAKVGLIRIGEMLSSQSLTILNKNNTSLNQNYAATYWTMTPFIVNYVAWIVHSTGDAYSIDVSDTSALRPVIVVNSSVTITSGNGLPNNPYQI